MALGIDIATAGGGGGGAYCLKKRGCGGGGISEFVYLLCSIIHNDFSLKFKNNYWADIHCKPTHSRLYQMLVMTYIWLLAFTETTIM